MEGSRERKVLKKKVKLRVLKGNKKKRLSDSIEIA